MNSIDPQTFLFLLATLVVASLVAGCLAGLFGIGGGAIYVPVLYQAFEALQVPHSVTMHLAIGSSIAIIVPTSVRSLYAHMKRGAVDMKLLREWVVAVPLGAVTGAILASAVSSEALRAIFAVLAATLALKLLFGRIPYTIADDLPGLAGRSVTGFAIGVFSSLMGIGGGILNNTFMTLYGRPMLQAVATSAGVGALIAVPGLVAYVAGGWNEQGLPPFSIGYVSLVALAVAVPVSVLTVPAGAALAHRLTRRQLELGFGIFLLIVAGRFVFSLL